MSEWNPALRPWHGAVPSARGGAGSYETYDVIRNIEWQTRAAPPNEYENQLADALMAAFDAGVADLPALAARLNGAHVFAPNGQAWTEATLTAELKRLGS